MTVFLCCVINIVSLLSYAIINNQDTPVLLFSYHTDFIRIWLSTASFTKGAQGYNTIGNLIDSRPIELVLGQRPDF